MVSDVVVFMYFEHLEQIMERKCNKNTHFELFDCVFSMNLQRTFKFHSGFKLNLALYSYSLSLNVERL